MPRKTYTVDFPDGHTQTFDGPVGMSDADAIQRAKQERGVQGGDISTSFAGGASRHLLEDEQPAVKALLGAAAGATGMPPLIAAVPAASRGLKHLSQFMRTGHTDAPAAGDLAWDAIEGGTAGYGGQLLAKTARGLGTARAGAENFAEQLPSWQNLPGWAKSTALPLDIATSKPALNFAERVGNFLTPGRVKQSFGNVAEGLTPGAADDAAALPLADRRAAWEQARAARQAPTVSPATGTGMPSEASQGVDTAPWLRRMGAEADAARPQAPRALEPTGTGAPAVAGQGADLEPWLQDMGDTATSHARGLARRAEFDAAQPGPRSLASTGTGSPAAAPDPFPNAQAPSWGASGREGSVETPAWLRRAGAKPEPVSVPSEAGPVGAEPSTAAPAQQFPGEGRYRAGVPEVDPAELAQQHNTAAQFEQFSPAARAARRGGLLTAPESPTGPAEGADDALTALLDTPAFRALLKATGAE